MFLIQIKNLFAKIKVNKILSNVKGECLLKPVKSIAVIFDEEKLNNPSVLITSLTGYGFDLENITLLAFEKNATKNNENQFKKFSYQDFSWNANLKNEQLLQFLKKDYDVLINYYNIDNPLLKLMSHWSNAKFKVGFSSIDQRLNHLIINSSIDKPKVFVDELFKYLKILNKI